MSNFQKTDEENAAQMCKSSNALEAYSEPCQTSKKQLKTVSGFKQLAIFAKSCIMDARQRSEYASIFLTGVSSTRINIKSGALTP